MSEDIYVCVCVGAASMSNGCSVQMVQEALQMCSNIICFICMSD